MPKEEVGLGEAVDTLGDSNDLAGVVEPLVVVGDNPGARSCELLAGGGDVMLGWTSVSASLFPFTRSVGLKGIGSLGMVSLSKEARLTEGRSE